MDCKKSLEDIEKAVDELIDENQIVPIIVEGEKDIHALRKLGATGEIIRLNSGVNLIDFCDKIAESFKEVIVLTDWDRKGGFLCRTITKNLEGRVLCNTYFREVFARHTMIKTLEGLPHWIDTIKEKVREV